MVEKATRQRGALNVWFFVLFYIMLINGGVPQAIAGPSGGQVVGGSSSISQAGNITTINQTTQNSAINWQSFNVNADERVHYIQPNASSISLNRILSQRGSTIAGRIDANGQVILVNPNGVFFTSTSVFNIGGIIASGLDIQPTDFMNGYYIFNEVLGTDGTVVNSGLINASLGGNVALIGKQVKNEGLIVAKLGSVNLAAGKQSVLTFDQGGLLGVRVTKEILQDELGVDPAVVNSGEIHVEGGRVLLTASTSQDVFSQAVNTDGIDQARSVVVHEDGSFTLGGGADVINTGSIDTSTTTNDQNVGRIILVGENVTNRGELRADADNGNAGEIELHSQNKTLLTENSVTSARSESNGQGGLVKVLGDKVGLFDQSTVDVSGANGGGQALIGGDFQGKNNKIRNASQTYVGRGVTLFADALATGDGGKLINWGDDYTWFYGSAFSRGGQQSGDGGLVEISGKGLAFDGSVDTSALNGQVGTLLFDPVDIIIHDGADPQNGDDELPVFSGGAGGNTFNISEGALEAILARTDILLQANRDITINDLTTDNSLDLLTGSGNSVTFTADANNDGTGSFIMNDLANTIRTQGGSVVIGGASVMVGNINTTGADNENGGNITVRANSGSIVVGALTSSGGAATVGNSGNDAGNIELRTDANPGVTDSITINGNIVADGSNADVANIGGNAGTITIVSGNGPDGEDSVTLNGDISAQGGNSGDVGNVGLNNNILIDTPVLLTAGNRTITTARTLAGNVNQGDITLDNNNGATDLTQVTLGGGLSISAGDSDDVNFNVSVDYNGITTGTLALNAGNNVKIVSDIIDSSTGTADVLTVSLNANTDGDTNGDVILNGLQNTNISINTGGGTYTVTGVNYDGDSMTNQKTTVDTGTGSANINVTGFALLGEMDVGGSLNVAAGTANASGFSISQGTGGSTIDTLTVTGVSSFTSTAVNGAIDLTNNNNLRGAIALATAAGATNNVNLNNTATTTTLNSVNVGGGLTVSADQNLTLANNVAVGGSATLDFGQGNNASTASTFTAQPGITYTAMASTITGSSANDTFNLAANISGTIDGGTGDDSFNINATVGAVLNGGAGNDVFTLGADNLSASINGGAGATDTDRIIGVDSAVTTVWGVTGTELGTLSNVNGLNVNFAEIESLTGGTGIDQFTVANGGSIGTLSGANNDDLFTVNGTVGTLNGDAGNDTIQLVGVGSVTGLIDGGDQAQDGVDHVDVSGRLGSVSIALGVDVANVEQLTGNNTDSTLIGTSAGNTFILSGENDGDVDGISFTNFNNLSGGNGDDTFTFLEASSLTGLIDGGGHLQGDRVNMSALLGSVMVELGVDIENIEQITGNNTDSALVGTSLVDAFVLDGENDGNVDGLSFTDFNKLDGKAGNDTFTVLAGGSLLNGVIEGGAGDDSLQVALAGQNGQIDFRGGIDNNSIVLLGGGSAYQESYTPSNIGGEFLFTDGGSNYSIKFSDASSIQDNVNADLSVFGTATDDTFELGTNNFVVNSATAVNYLNKRDLAFRGLGGGADVITLLGDVSVPGRVTLSAESVVNTSGSRITSDSLALDNVSAAGTADARLLTNVNNLFLTDSGAVYLDEQDQLTIAQMTATGEVDIRAENDIDSSVGLISDFGLTALSSSGNITLGQVNQFVGPMNLSATSGTITLANSVDTDLANVSANNLSVTVSGNIASTGVIGVTGTTDLIASGGDITLSGDHNFSTISAEAVNVELHDVNSIEQLDIAATGTVDVRAETDLGLGGVTGANIQLDASAGQISDTNGVDVNLTAAQVTLRAATGIGSADALETQTAKLDAINTTGSMEITNTGSVTLSNLVTQGDINFINTGNVTLDKVDAGFNTGTLDMRISNGSVFGVERDFRTVADITANNALIDVSGDFGTPFRPISVQVNNEFALFSNVGSVFFFGDKPDSILDNSTVKISLFDALLGLSGQQLIEVETLSEVDPAIFTEVRNYYLDEISILLPADQRYDNEDEDWRFGGRGAN